MVLSRDRILSTILSTFRTFYLDFLVHSTLFAVQVHVLVLQKVYCVLVLSTNVPKYKCTVSTNILSTDVLVQMY